MKFKSVEELIKLAMENEACTEGIDFASQYFDLKLLFRDLKRLRPDYFFWVIINIIKEIKPGDKALVVKRQDFSQNCWADSWVQGMTQTIGNDYEVKFILASNYGIALSNNFNYSPFSIKIIRGKNG